jgi:hypothetical protein
MASNQGGPSTCKRARKPVLQHPHLDALEEKVDRQQERINELQRREIHPQEPEPDQPHSMLWDNFTRNDKWVKLTNFTQFEVHDIWFDVDVAVHEARKRGPKPSVGYFDSFVIYLMWSKSGLDIPALSVLLQVPESTLEGVIERIRPILHAALTKKWWSHRPRPKPLIGTNHPYIAMLADHNTTEVNKPKVRFEEAKAYWDDHNKIYGLKKEVALQAKEPHFALFVSKKAAIGAVHDYKDHKENNYKEYIYYLTKTPEELDLIPTDRDHPNWAVLLDMAYIGQEEDTPGERRITPYKYPKTQAERNTSHELQLIRVPVEQFFGRMQKLFAIFREVYRWDHEHFDTDYEIGVLLTNEHIAHTALVEDDQRLYHALREDRIRKYEEKKAKRKESVKKCKEKKKRRLAEIFI